MTLEPGGVLVSLSSGETFYVEADFIQVLHLLEGASDRLVMVGNRAVNPGQVAQVQYVREIPTVHGRPERLEEE